MHRKDIDLTLLKLLIIQSYTHNSKCSNQNKPHDTSMSDAVTGNESNIKWILNTRLFLPHVFFLSQFYTCKWFHPILNSPKHMNINIWKILFLHVITHVKCLNSLSLKFAHWQWGWKEQKYNGNLYFPVYSKWDMRSTKLIYANSK